jgi:hypothetical protein
MSARHAGVALREGLTRTLTGNAWRHTPQRKAHASAALFFFASALTGAPTLPAALRSFSFFFSCARKCGREASAREGNALSEPGLRAAAEIEDAAVR